MPVETFELSTREPDVARAVLTELYCPDHQLGFSGVDSSIACESSSATAGSARADRRGSPPPCGASLRR